MGLRVRRLLLVLVSTFVLLAAGHGGGLAGLAADNALSAGITQEDPALVSPEPASRAVASMTLLRR
jgi:hypothetical protein